MPRKPLKPRDKKSQVEAWQLEILKTGWHEWWQVPERSEKFRRSAFLSFRNRQEKIWRSIRDQVDWKDYPYAVQTFEGVENA